MSHESVNGLLNFVLNALFSMFFHRVNRTCICILGTRVVAVDLLLEDCGSDFSVLIVMNKNLRVYVWNDICYLFRNQLNILQSISEDTDYK